MSQEFCPRAFPLSHTPMLSSQVRPRKGIPEDLPQSQHQHRTMLHAFLRSPIDCLLTDHFLSYRGKEGLMVGDGKWCQVLVHIRSLIYRGPASWTCIFMRWHVFTVWFQHSYKSSTYVIRELRSTAHCTSSFPCDPGSKAFLQPFHDLGCQNALMCAVISVHAGTSKRWACPQSLLAGLVGNTGVQTLD